MPAMPIFEQSTSALYYSNDGRLHVVVVDSGTGERALELDGAEVFRTLDPVKADAYIAGYDLCERELRDADDRQHRRDQELRATAAELGIDL